MGRKWSQMKLNFLQPYPISSVKRIKNYWKLNIKSETLTVFQTLEDLPLRSLNSINLCVPWLGLYHFRFSLKICIYWHDKLMQRNAKCTGARKGQIYMQIHIHVLLCVHIYYVTNRFNISEKIYKKLVMRLPLEWGRARIWI